mmetsp:Transcript_30862/g.35142  ORF Transcript_30862/g.35142 Transcript_30862/m.35142 type:complete len:245 (+) Transcript_30862:672-1406(+)
MAASKKPLVAITGASSGIGEGLAKFFSQLGHPLLLMARRVDKMEALNLPNTICVKTDVTEYAQIESAIKQAEEKYGPVDLMINNAGVMYLNMAEAQVVEEWDQMIDVNIKGVLNGIKAVFAGMKERKSGTIVNVSSTCGRKLFATASVYCATKFAVHALTEQMREEAAPANVRFITIAPGFVESELREHISDDNIRGYVNQAEKALPEGALKASHVAEAIAFAYNQPQWVCIREIVLAPTGQAV